MNVRSEIEAAHAKRGRGRPLVDDKRRIILDAAIRVFGERGFHGTSVPDIAAAAGVGTGTLYRYFEHKEGLVNEVFRDAKLRLRAAMLDNAPALDPNDAASSKRWFTELWRRLGGFAMTEPAAFRFLEMQDHVEYLDHESRELELSLLGPLFFAGKQILDSKQAKKRGAAPPGARVDTLIALLWGAFVGLVKASRLGYLVLDDEQIKLAGEAAWQLIATAR
ncbi:MAG TPA: TetR/AcrR family transcriptional regulator [Kofleriaceae bacterium]|jgi:AcrR family transcriptional regulator